jgi:hypothetical protein
LLDAQQDAVAVQRAELDGFQNEHFERAAQEIELLVVFCWQFGQGSRLS